MPSSKEHYIAERIKAGENAEVAREMSDSQFAELFPDASPAEGQHVMNVLEDCGWDAPSRATASPGSFMTSR
jgi:hypothetical protein